MNAVLRQFTVCCECYVIISLFYGLHFFSFTLFGMCVTNLMYILYNSLSSFVVQSFFYISSWSSFFTVLFSSFIKLSYRPLLSSSFSSHPPPLYCCPSPSLSSSLYLRHHSSVCHHHLNLMYKPAPKLCLLSLSTSLIVIPAPTFGRPS